MTRRTQANDISIQNYSPPQEEIVSENSYSRRQKELRLEREAIKNAARKEVIEKWKKHPFWLFRFSYQVLHSISIVVISIAGFIAWLIATLFI